jgi:hypothetical protein
MKHNDTDVSPIQQLLKQFYHRAFRNTFILGIVLALVWLTLTIFVPVGWPMAVVNILFFLLSILLFCLPMQQLLKASLPTWLAFLSTILLWALIFVGIRSLLSAFI